MIRKLINSQISLSRRLDRLLPRRYAIDGNQDYLQTFVPKYLRPNVIIYDVGGGKAPYLSPGAKQMLNATVIGLDIDKTELNKAPPGSYDKVICADITTYVGAGDADIVLCQALLEHVKDTAKAMSAISSILKNGGLALVFVPCRNSVYARLNMLLPQNIKKAILHKIYPHTEERQGFPAYYDKCTPSDFHALAAKNNFTIVEERFYFISSYFSFFVPAYLVWRMWVFLFSALAKKQAAETFAIALRKRR